MLLIKNVHLYAPEYLGLKDVLISDKIECIADTLTLSFPELTIIDGNGKSLTPGLIDPHIHITGGGGEGSFHTQVPPVRFSELVSGGITTLVGLLGTDSVSRHIENLIAKAKALKEEGLTVYALTGAYRYPSPTLTGSIQKDILFIDEIIGTKLALSDHRSSSVSAQEIARLAGDTYTAGLLSGKEGFVTLHMGDAKAGLSAVYEALELSAVPIKTFHPTHVNRNPSLLKEAFNFARQGGFIDLTCGTDTNLSAASCIVQALNDGVPASAITLSSDGMGSWSVYDESGYLTDIGYAPVNTVLKTVKELVFDYSLSFSQALAFATVHSAKSLGLYPQKGCIAPGSDADLLLFDDTLHLEAVIAGGVLLMEDGFPKKGTYE